MMSILFLLVGLGLILSGANFLTDGAAALAKRFNKKTARPPFSGRRAAFQLFTVNAA